MHKCEYAKGVFYVCSPSRTSCARNDAARHIFVGENRMEDFNLSELLSNISVSAVTGFLFKLIGVIALFVIGLWVAKGLSKLVRKACGRSKIDETVSQFLGRGVYWVTLIVVVLACLSIFGIETTSVAAILGAAGLAVGLAFQGTLSNFAAGLMIILFRPFKIGDFVTVDGNSGTVQTIDFFQTDLVTPDNRRIIVPNSKIYGSTIENVSAFEKRRVDVSVSVSPSADIEETRKQLESALQIEGILEGEPHCVVLSDLSATSVDWSVRVWCATGDYWTVRERLVNSVKHKIDEAKIETPVQRVQVTNR